MINLIPIDDESYGGDSRAINRHRTKTYQIEGENTFLCLSRCKDVIPPYFEMWLCDNKPGFVKYIKIDGKELWGDGISWKKAYNIFKKKIEEICNGNCL